MYLYVPFSGVPPSVPPVDSQELSGFPNQYFCACGLFFESNYKLERHRWNDHIRPHSLTPSMKKPTPYGLRRHMKTHEGSAGDVTVVQERYICMFCDKRHDTSTQLKDHELECRHKHYSGGKWFSCSKCSRTFHSASFLRSHSKIHLEQKFRNMY